MLDRKARNLTADAKQKISLGRGLVRADVRAILFDEPLTVIDPHLKWQLRSTLKELHRRLDLTMIYVTHDQTEALTFADKVVVMHDGAVVQMGTPEELFERPAHTFVGYFIGSPGMNVLPAEVEGATARVGGAAIAAAAAPIRPRRGPAHRDRRAAGIRPARGREAPALPVQVRRIDDVGRARIARVELAGQPIAATSPRTPSPSTGDEAASASILEQHPRLCRRPPRRRRGAEGAPMDKTVNKQGLVLVLPVFVIVAFSAVMPLMTVVNYSVQDTFGNNQFFWNGIGWFQELLDPSTELGSASATRSGATSSSPPSSSLIEVPLGIVVALSHAAPGLERRRSASS